GYGASRGAHYYCRKLDRAESCKMMIPVAVADSKVEDMFTSNPDMTFTREVTIKGHNFQDDIDHLALDIKGLDVTADDFIEQATAMKAEMKRLASLPAEPDRVELQEVKFSEVIGMWNESTDEEKRQMFTGRGLKLYAFKVEGELVFISGTFLSEAQKLLA